MENKEAMDVLGGRRRRLCLVVVICSLVALVGQAQPTVATISTAASAKLEFDVASVKQNKSDDLPQMNFSLGPGDWYVPNGGNFIATNLPLIRYINFAYKITANQADAITKQLPAWVMTEKYDIIAKTDKHDATKDDMRLMMRSLLADRFKLAVHSETQQVPVYALGLARPGVLGPKLVPHAADQPCSALIPKPGEDGKIPPRAVDGGFPYICGGITDMPSKAPGMRAMGARNVPVSLLASALSEWGNLGRPVLDQTGLTGKYDVLLEFAPDSLPGPNQRDYTSAALDTAGPGFAEALSKQLGLKLKPQKGPVDVWIVDHVERPTEN